MATFAYTCPNCGGGLAFDAGKQAFVCEFCLASFDKATVEAASAEAVDTAGQASYVPKDPGGIGGSDGSDGSDGADGSDSADMVEYDCPSCGAQVTADLTTAATFCAYCHNPVVLVGRLSGEQKPQKIIPFKFDRSAATQKFLTFAKKKWFAPKAFSAPEQLEKLTGIYYPFWVTDADTDAGVDGKGDIVRVWRTGKYEYTEISHYRIYRRGKIHFEDIVTGALSEADKKMLEGILPYPAESMEPFSMPYLSGFLAKKRDIEQQAVEGEVRARMDDYATTLLRGTIQGFSNVRLDPCVQTVEQCNWDYTLLPIWILTYRGKRKPYTFAMNGETGKVYGEVPLSVPKLFLTAGILFALVTLLCLWIGGVL